MKREKSAQGSATARFHTTQWDAILLSAQSRAPGSEAALAELCRLYWHPLYAFVRRSGYEPDDAKDLVQGFFLHVLSHKVLRRVSPQKGKFRSFLLASLQNYLSNEGDRSRCQKRGGRIEFVRLDGDSDTDIFELESPQSLLAGTVFDARWAITVLDLAMTRLRKKYASERKIAILDELEVFLDPLNGESPPSYEQIARKIHVNADSVGVLIHRLRKQYAAILREEVARTVSRPEEVDDEIRSLCDALIAAQGLCDS